MNQESNQLISLIDTLPINLQTEVSQFVEYLLYRNQVETTASKEPVFIVAENTNSGFLLLEDE